MPDINMNSHQLELFPGERDRQHGYTAEEFAGELRRFSDFGKRTRVLDFPDDRFPIPVFVNEFWTSRQRAAHSLHEVSYRACFKPQLPRFFIERLTVEGDIIYDPFMGRGTTLVEAGLLGRRAAGCDINPLSRVLVSPRFDPPSLAAVRKRLDEIDLERDVEVWKDLLVFYNANTLVQIANLREYLRDRERSGTVDAVDGWIRMVATNRLTGHSPGFFSVYTMPPNQAVSIESQRKINARRHQTPPERNVRELIWRKTKSLLHKLDEGEITRLKSHGTPLLITGSSDRTPALADGSVALAVTSPPFLDTVDYRADNWLRCWFNGFDAQAVSIWQLKDPQEWQAAMTGTFRELRRVLRRGGHVAFEVGEVRGGQILLETLVAPAAAAAGLTPLLVMVNSQAFTKTSNCWGIDNLRKGTNTNRIVLLEKRDE
jgi:hypothetical protein